MNWARVPLNIPDEFRAMENGSTGSMITFLPWVQAKKNAEWINYTWSDQQRLMNTTWMVLPNLGQELHENTRMTMQNHNKYN